MSYKVNVPRSISSKIAAWGLTRDQLVQVLTALHHELPARLDGLSRLSAPSPTWVFSFSFPVEENPIQIHVVTFWITLEEREGYLYVDQCDHVIDDDLGEDEE